MTISPNRSTPRPCGEFAGNYRTQTSIDARMSGTCMFNYSSRLAFDAAPLVVTMRPYRSHKIPACDRCRRQKRRCTNGGPGNSCLLCRLQNTPCQYSEPAGERRLGRPPSKAASEVISRPDGLQSPSSGRNARTPISSSTRRTRPRYNQATEESIGGAHYSGNLNNEDSVAKSSMIVSPVITEDIQVLDQFMSDKSSNTTRRRPQNLHSDGSDDPVLYLSVPRRREGLVLAENPGIKQKTIISHLVAPYANELIDLSVPDLLDNLILTKRQVFPACSPCISIPGRGALPRGISEKRS